MKIFNVNFNAEMLSLKELIQFAEIRAVTTDILKEYIVTSLLEDDNVLSQICEKSDIIGDSLKSVALEDLNELWKEMSLGILEHYVPSVKRKLSFCEYQQSLESVIASDTPEQMLDRIILHYSTFGAGKNAQYIAFRWQHGLTGIDAPDGITMDRLFCLNNQKDVLIENTSLFLQGLPANNALLYGDSGSGKSSMIKALLNQYYHKGLRLIEISKDSLDDLPQLIHCVRDKKLKYIIFIDDLSFESNDTGYKNLKVILDGQIEKQPQNILLYATSNRFHLINETWQDRQGDEVFVKDTMNEKLSLSERFGIRVIFSSPKIGNQYFEIIAGILANENIPLTDEIKAEAIRWELLYNGRSGRTASQFARKIISSHCVSQKNFPKSD